MRHLGSNSRPSRGVLRPSATPPLRRAAEALELRRHGFGKMKCSILRRSFGPYVVSIERVARNPRIGRIWGLAFPGAFCSRKNGGGTMLNRPAQKPRIPAAAGLEPR